MEYDSRTYFDEIEHDDVKGFTILQGKDGRYHIGEKWLKESGDDVWMDYWIQADDLSRRVENGDCEPKGTLTDEQFEGVCRKVGWRYDEGEAQVEA